MSDNDTQATAENRFVEAANGVTAYEHQRWIPRLGDAESPVRAKKTTAKTRSLRSRAATAS